MQLRLKSDFFGIVLVYEFLDVRKNLLKGLALSVMTLDYYFVTLLIPSILYQMRFEKYLEEMMHSNANNVILDFPLS